MDTFVSMFSVNRGAWCVYKSDCSLTTTYYYRCRNQEDSEKLAEAINNGAVTCRGCKTLGSACGHCVVCELTV